MKRANQLQPLSRQHQIEDNLIANALEPYRATESDVASVLETLDGQHKQLHQLINTVEQSQKSGNKGVSVAQVHELGTLLYDHIRFEERELYPTVEKYLTEAELDAVYEASPDSIKRPDESR